MFLVRSSAVPLVFRPSSWRCWPQMSLRSDGYASATIEPDRILHVSSCFYHHSCPIPPPAVLMVLDEYSAAGSERREGTPADMRLQNSFMVIGHLTLPPQQYSPSETSPPPALFIRSVLHHVGGGPLLAEQVTC